MTNERIQTMLAFGDAAMAHYTSLSTSELTKLYRENAARYKRFPNSERGEERLIMRMISDVLDERGDDSYKRYSQC